MEQAKQPFDNLTHLVKINAEMFPGALSDPSRVAFRKRDSGGLLIL